MVIPRISSEFYIRACFPYMVMYSIYDNVFQIWSYLIKIGQLSNMGCFPNMGMVSKYGHIFQIGTYLEIRSITKCRHVVFSKYGYGFQLWSYCPNDLTSKFVKLPNMGMFSNLVAVLTSRDGIL